MSRATKSARRPEVTYKLDRTAPTVDDASIDGSRKWVGDGDLRVTAAASDGGAGVRVLHLLHGGKEIAASDPACDQGADCPETLRKTLNVDRSQLGEGSEGFAVVAEDAAGNRSEPRGLGEVKVDRGAPQVTTSGSLVAARGTELSGGEYTLQVTADDGSSRSGVKRIAFRVDGKAAGEHVEDCASSCPAKASARYVFRANKEGTGDHTVEVETTDLAGNTETSEVDAASRRC